MHSKRSLIRVLARILYACGFVLLVAGILLSAAASTYASSPSPASVVESYDAWNAVEVPYTGIQNSLPIQEPTIDPSCDCIRTPTTPVETQPSGSPSSLVFTSGCDCTCESVTAVLCNLGGDMKEAVDVQLYYNASGNPADGQVVKRGPIGPLSSGKCVALNYEPVAAGNYAFHLRQEPGADGPRDVWSSACRVDGSCYPTPTVTETPFQPATNTPTTGAATETPVDTFTPTAPAVELTLTPTMPAETLFPPTPTSPSETLFPPTPTSPSETLFPPTPTSPSETLFPPTPTAPVETIQPPTPTQPSQQMPINLSFICGYAGDDYLLWWVRNSTAQDVEYVWRVSGSSEQGGGTVKANSVTYFTTSPGQKTVRLYINDSLIDSAESAGPCKENLTLAVICTEAGQVFVARNPNNFNVDYTWTIDGQPGGTGMLPAGASVNLVTVPQGNHTVQLTWTDTRPGSHTVSLTSSPEDCIYTPTPVASSTPVASATPVATDTPVGSATPTASPTAPFVEITLTPTPTNTQPVVNPPTPTFITPSTPTGTVTPPVVGTPTATATNTQPVVIPPTPTNTSTATQTITNTPPVVIITTTPVPPTPTSTATQTATVAPTSTATSTATNLPPIIITATPSFTPTTTPTAPFVIVTATFTSTAPVIVITTTPVAPTPTFITPATFTSTPTATQTPQVIVVTPQPTATQTSQIVPPQPPASTSTATQTPQPTSTPQIIVVTPVPSNTPQIIVVTPIPVTGASATPTELVTLAPPVIVITTTPALIPQTGADLIGPGALISLGSLGGLFTNLGLFMLGTALALTGIRSLLSR